MDDARDDRLNELRIAAERERSEASLRQVIASELEVRARYAAMLETIRDEPVDGPEAEARRDAYVQAGRDLIPLIEQRLELLREGPNFADVAAEIHLNHTDATARASELALITEVTAATAGAVDALLALLWELQYRTAGGRRY